MPHNNNRCVILFIIAWIDFPIVLLQNDITKAFLQFGFKINISGRVYKIKVAKCVTKASKLENGII